MNNKTQAFQSSQKNLYLEYALFLILGFLLGIVIKTEAEKRITVGFNDYQVDMKQETYNINELQKSFAEKSAKENPPEDLNNSSEK